jgi:CheY-like chemotaxis protein
VARILVIDDEELVRLTVKQILDAAGYEVTTAVNGEDGVRQFRQRPVDLVVCDIFMPRMSGITTLKELRTLRPDLPVIIMSGGMPDAIRGETEPVDYLELARLMGAVATIAKPFRAAALIAVVQQQLQGD